MLVRFQSGVEMDAKLDCEVDVEGAVGAVDMIDRGEGGISRRPCLRPDAAHSPRASRQSPNKRRACCGYSMLPVRTTRSFPNQFSVQVAVKQFALSLNLL